MIIKTKLYGSKRPPPLFSPLFNPENIFFLISFSFLRRFHFIIFKLRVFLWLSTSSFLLSFTVFKFNTLTFQKFGTSAFRSRLGFLLHEVPGGPCELLWTYQLHWREQALHHVLLTGKRLISSSLLVAATWRNHGFHAGYCSARCATRSLALSTTQLWLQQ